MPLYAFKCNWENCDYTEVVMRTMADCGRAPSCIHCKTAMKRDWAGEPKGTPSLDYDKAILCDSVGVAPSQVAEHRRLHPNIPMNDAGQVVVKNGAEEKRIKKALTTVFSNPEG